MGTREDGWLGYKARSFELLSLADGDQVLDVGCGTGEDVRTIAGRGAVVSVIGIDASEEKVREARALTLGLPRPVDFRVADACALPFEDETFDACRADRVFHHLVDPSRALAEMARVTRPGGRVVVSDTDYDSLVVEAPDLELTCRILAHHADRMESGRVGRRLPGMFRDAGLAAVTVTPYAALATGYDEDGLKLRDKAERAAKTGAVAPGEAARWVDSLVAADRAGRFVCAQIVLTVGGRKA
ncbi:MAG TPA: methyltransferase domain-containing protein [Methylomirabilota bacterium]|nr:methyltransferase domain-containing protein [Methylomirabilota bacterium]